ncbi:MAG: hypothetical protein ACXADC_09450 [Candidatus Thorarchaeota archaeon]|jgi:hypothetical protein
MTWAPLLLADRSPSLRRLVLKELLERSGNDTEVAELESLMVEDPQLAPLIRKQSDNGSWKNVDIGGSKTKERVRATSFALQRLGYAGLPPDHPAITKGVEYIFSRQRTDGSWSIPRTYDASSLDGGVYTMVPLQASVPLLGIAAAGYATDHRAERAYEWLIERRLDDGAWPTGKVGKVLGYRAGYRRMPHSEWACRTNTTLALTALAYHPTRRSGPEAKRALDLLLGRETRDRQNVGLNVARLMGFEQHRGHFTYHARFDPVLILDLCWRIGANRSDERVKDLVSWFEEQQGPCGLWEYQPRPEATRWVTFDILRSLSRVDNSKEWVSQTPKSPFSAYPKRKKRF